MTLEHDEESKAIQEALKGSAKDHLLKAINEENESMRINEIWDLVDLPEDRKTIRNK